MLGRSAPVSNVGKYLIGSLLAVAICAGVVAFLGYLPTKAAIVIGLVSLVVSYLTSVYEEEERRQDREAQRTENQKIRAQLSRIEAKVQNGHRRRR